MQKYAPKFRAGLNWPARSEPKPSSSSLPGLLSLAGFCRLDFTSVKHIIALEFLILPVSIVNIKQLYNQNVMPTDKRCSIEQGAEILWDQIIMVYDKMDFETQFQTPNSQTPNPEFNFKCQLPHFTLRYKISLIVSPQCRPFCRYSYEVEASLSCANGTD